MSFIEEIDNSLMQAFISALFGAVLGYLYRVAAPSTIIINANDNTLLDKMENNGINTEEKCYRYKKIETSCDN